ncbi:MAG: HU family DNA-binding protein [Candidatus Goldbacteria bacterium]|nr:HU family DNA-binding protein [Candidatus Goldiibacteriota bacterium]
MTKTEMYATIAEKAGVSKKEAKTVLEAFNSEIIEVLKKEKKVKLPGLGIFVVKERKARMGRNPKTGETIQIPAKKVVKFRVAKDVKKQVL